MFRTVLRLAFVAALVAGSWAGARASQFDQGYLFHGEAGDGDSTAGAAYLGVDLRDVTSDRVSALKLKEERGAEVTMVDQDAPAGKAGLKEHDVILEVNGQRVESVEQLRRMIKEMPPGRTISLNLSRDGQPMTLKATLADRRKMMGKMWMHSDEPMSMMPAIPAMPAMPAVPAMPVIDIPNIEVNVRSFSSTGMVIESLSPQLGDYFGVKDGDGVLVRSVEKGSAADKAGLKAGDVIIRVDKDHIADRGDWRSAMRHRSGKVSLGIMRDRREQTIILTLPEKPNPDNSFRFDWPDVDFQALQKELDALRPEIEKTTAQAMMLARDQMGHAMRDAGVEFQRQMKQARKDMEKARKEMEKAQKQAEKAAQDSMQ